MKYGLDITAAGPWGRPDQIAALATLAETHGWDGVFCEDYVRFQSEDRLVDTYDVWVTLGLVAQATERLTIGTMVTPVPRRRPWTLAAQAMTVDQLSGGRLVLGVGIGDVDEPNFAAFGEPTDLRERAEMLDEALDILDRLWSGQTFSYAGRHFRLDQAQLLPPTVARPRIPIWVGGALTKPRPRRRALRWDGACLYRIPVGDGWEDVTPDDVRRLRADVEQRPDGGAGYVIAVGGRERADGDAGVEADQRLVTALAEAGADWWHEYVPPRLSFDDARRLIEAGPVRAAA